MNDGTKNMLDLMFEVAQRNQKSISELEKEGHFLDRLPTNNPHKKQTSETKPPAKRILKSLWDILSKNPLISGIVATVIGSLIVYFILK